MIIEAEAVMEPSVGHPRFSIIACKGIKQKWQDRAKTDLSKSREDRLDCVVKNVGMYSVLQYLQESVYLLHALGL